MGKRNRLNPGLHILRFPTRTFCLLRKAMRRQLNEEANVRNVKLPVIEPWPEPVKGAEVLDEVSARYTRVVLLPAGAADAMTLWTAHAHAYEAFAQTPRLNLSSPES